MPEFRNHPARLAAIAAGQQTYATIGEPCAKNHEPIRSVHNGTCIECNKLIRRARREAAKAARPPSDKVAKPPPKKMACGDDAKASRPSKLRNPLAHAIAQYSRNDEAAQRSAYLDQRLKQMKPLRW
jgi:hypothetical protein